MRPRLCVKNVEALVSARCDEHTARLVYHHFQVVRYELAPWIRSLLPNPLELFGASQGKNPIMPQNNARIASLDRI